MGYNTTKDNPSQNVKNSQEVHFTHEVAVMLTLVCRLDSIQQQCVAVCENTVYISAVVSNLSCVQPGGSGVLCVLNNVTGFHCRLY